MAKKSCCGGSKGRLIHSVIELLPKEGYENLGINDILEHADVSKSNFYYHFKSKEELCLTAFDAIIDFFQEKILNTTLLNAALTPKARIVGLFQKLRESMEHTCCKVGCPFVNIATETSDHHPLFREKVDTFFDLYRSAIAKALQAGVDSGDFRGDFSVEGMAQLVLSTINGTMVLMKASKELDIIEQNRDTLIELIKK